MTESTPEKEMAQSQESLGEDTEMTANSSQDDEATQLTIEARREKNSLAPINQLPTELLIPIFNASLEEYPDRLEGLKTLASVAWLWNDIIRQSHGLWAVLDSRTPAEHLPIFLQRAGNFPLTIKMHPESIFHTYEVLDENTQSPNAAFLDRVLVELDRWEEASVLLGYGLENIKERLEQPALSLERFHLEGGEISQIDLFQGQAPNLSELSIQGLSIRWNSAIFQDLRSITIWGVPNDGPTAEEVVQWIVSSPRLRSFQLAGSTLTPSTGHQNILPGETPHLKSLNISDIPSSSAQFILSRIRTPALRELIVRPNPPALTETVHLPTFFDAALQHLSPAIGSSIDHAQGLGISLFAPRGSINVTTNQETDRKEGILIDLDHQPGLSGLQLCLELLLQNVSSCPPISLSIMGLKGVTESDLLWILDSQGNDKVTELSIRNGEGDVILAFLCQARYQSGVAKWPFPKLKRLLLPFSTDTSVERLARPLRQRYAPDLRELSATLTSDPQSPLILGAPDRLEALNVAKTAFSRAEYDLLSNILGPGVIQVPIREDEDRPDGSE